MVGSEFSQTFSDTRRQSTTSSRPTPSRRETIMSLVELLLKHGDNENSSQGQDTDNEDGHVRKCRSDKLGNKFCDRSASVDDHLQAIGAEIFCRFQKRINNLDKELRNFANSARQLGSSVAILSSTFHLRERLAQLLYLYHENAARLFPRMVSRADSVNMFDPSFLEARRKHWKRIKFKGSPHVARPMVSEKLEMEQFPHYFEALAKDVTTFLHCLNEFPEFTDEAVNISIMSFEGDLKYWSSCLREYKGQFRHSAVQRYIHDLSSELGEHIDNITAALSMFIEVGVPTIRFAQKHGAMNLLNLSTIATFFSAVTATCLQYSFNSLDSSIANSVNGFWFASLVFSIAAAVNSLLGLTWKQAMYRSPGHRVPWWVLIWIKRSPLVFLVISNACFSLGLCCFTYSSGQHYVTSTITTVFTAFTSFGLVAVSTWFASERWAFQQHEGKKWLSDILIEAKDTILQIPPFRYLVSAMKFMKLHCTKFLNYMRHVRHKASDLLPTHVDSKDTSSSTITPPCMMEVPATPTDPMNPLFRATTDIKTSRPVPLSKNLSMPNLRDLQTEESISPRSPRELWDRAFSGVLSRSSLSQMGLATAASNNQRASLRQPTASSNLSFGPGDRRYGNSEENSQAILKSRITALISDIKPLEVTQDLAAHEALVRHLQFSPDGKYLATSSWDKTTTILRVGDPFVIHRIIAHSTAQGFVGQVVWSPCGKYLLTRLSRGIKIWSALDGSCNMIDRPAIVQAVAWFPRSEEFISIEGNSVTKIDICGNITGTYHFGNMKLQDVAVSTDSKYLLGVGPLLESPSGLQPSKSRVEKRLAVFNMEANQIESMTPVLDDVKHVTLASTRHGPIALVSYDCKASQVWMLESFHRDGVQPVTRLTLKHTYLPKTPTQFTGPSYFGGKNNELVLSADKAGIIHIWDQEAGVLLHRVQTQLYGGNLTCMAWSPGNEPFMLATGTHDGSVRIWTKSNTNRSDGAFIPRSTSPTPFIDIDLSEAAALRISPARSGSDVFPSYTY